MSTTTLHTPLEVLLFFQSLRTLGPESPSFLIVSESLKENDFVREGDTYEPDRLTPGSLKELYLQLLKRELQGERVERDSSDQDVNHNPRKRKLSSSPSPIADEAT